MSFKEKTLPAHYAAAEAYSLTSTAVRQKVGAVLVKNDNPIACGYNGTYPGDDNACEVDGVTKPDVIHAEINCLDKLRNSHETAAGATMVVTHEPCLACAREIVKSQVAAVVFRNYYQSTKSPGNFDGLEYLIKRGVSVKLFKVKSRWKNDQGNHEMAQLYPLGLSDLDLMRSGESARRQVLEREAN